MLITVNHYYRPGFRAWWLALAISAVVRLKIYWVITSAWTYPDWLRSHSITPLTSIILSQIARVYDFITMPPMPPRAEDARRRALAVRKIIALARNKDHTIIAIAPEGRDPVIKGRYAPTNPPPNVGRMINHLLQLNFKIIPVGAYEAEGRLCLNFGSAYRIAPPAELEKTKLDEWISHAVMKQISDLIPII